MGTGVRHIDRYKTEILLVSQSAAGSTLWIDMQYYSHVTFFLAVSNSTGTPAATVTINQATAVAGTSSKSLAYNNYFLASGGFATQSSGADVWSQSSSAVAGTFGIISTVSTLFGYCIEIQDTDLDLNNLFKAVQLSLGAVSSTQITVIAHCFPRFDGNFAAFITALT